MPGGLKGLGSGVLWMFLSWHPTHNQVDSSARGAIAKYHKWGLKEDMACLTVLEAEV
jgi:hypothetical protein